MVVLNVGDGGLNVRAFQCGAHDAPFQAGNSAIGFLGKICVLPELGQVVMAGEFHDNFVFRVCKRVNKFTARKLAASSGFEPRVPVGSVTVGIFSDKLGNQGVRR